MFKPSTLFSGFSVNNIDEATAFYGDTLGLPIAESMGGISIELPSGARAWAYVKEDHQPAGYTTLNFVVDDIDEAYDALTMNGVVFEKYPDSYQDAKGIMRGKEVNMGPNIAWFKDPAGNILAILEN